MKTIYLCGAINGCTDAQCKDWREKVKEELKSHYNFLDPMRRDFRGRENECVNEIVQGDYEDIQQSDILLVAADKPSWGTAMEMHHAFGLGKTVIAVCGAERISPWLKYHSHRLFGSLDVAIEYLRLSWPAQPFFDHLEKASETVKNWPEWKQSLLGKI